MAPVNRKPGAIKSEVSPAETQAFGFRLTDDMRKKLDLIAEFLGYSTSTEMVRGWAIARANEIWNSPRMVQWMKATYEKDETPEEKPA